MILEEGLAKLGLLQARVQKLLELYIKEIELFNPAYGLVKVQDRRELVVKHILDSLAPLNILINHLKNKPEKSKIGDVGSGAGLPGIPLAVCMPDVEFTLIERMGRRAGFLRDAIAVMGLSNVIVKEADLGEINLSAEECFDIVVFRAFSKLESGIIEGLFRILAPDGILASYKGRRQLIEEEISRLESRGGKNLSPGSQPALPKGIQWEIFPLEVPFLEEERHLVLIRPALQVRSF